jgi:hypothetical protein
LKGATKYFAGTESESKRKQDGDKQMVKGVYNIHPAKLS